MSEPSIRNWPTIHLRLYVILGRCLVKLHSQILHNLRFSFLLGITAAPREIENQNYAIFFLRGGGGVNKVHYGKCASDEYACFVFPGSLG